MLILNLMASAKGLITMEKIIRDKGQPCLVLFIRSNGKDRVPDTNTLVEGFLYKDT